MPRPITLFTGQWADLPLAAEPDYPTIDDGVTGMAFIETVVKSSSLGAKWVKFPDV